MADVQLEHGHTRIADSLYEALIRAPMPGRHKDVVHSIIRLTYGYQKTHDRIGSSQIAGLVGCTPSMVRRVLRDLTSWGVITRTGGGSGRGDSPVIGLVKDFEKWAIGTTEAAREKVAMRQRSGTTEPPFDVEAVRQSGTEGGPFTDSESGTTNPVKRYDKPDKAVRRRTTPKRTKDNQRELFVEGEDLAKFFLGELTSNVEHVRRPASLDSWAETFGLMLRGTQHVDPIPIEDIRRVIRWTVRDDFWAGNVLSAKKLRERFSTLHARATQPQKPAKAAGAASKATEGWKHG